MADTNTENTSTKGRRAKLTDVRDSALDRARTTVEGLEANPVGLLVGGIAVGLVAGALIPRSERETAVLRPVGKKLAAGAIAAVAAAKETSKEQLTASLLSKDAAKESARKVFDSAVSAVKDKDGEGAQQDTGSSGQQQAGAFEQNAGTSGGSTGGSSAPQTA